MALSVDDALSAYGFVYTLADSIPELKSFLTQATKEEWTPEKLTAKVESSNWWNTHADTVRTLATLQATDPATYNQNLANAKNLVTLKAQQLGRAVDDKAITRLAINQLTTNASWDDQVLAQAVTNGLALYVNHDVAGTAAYVGNAAALSAHMNQLAENYGVPVTKDWMRGMISQIQSGRDTIDGFTSLMQARATAAYPQFADQFKSGMTLKDIADPYISTMATTLEVPETQITLKDSHIRKALASTAEDGVTQKSMPLWQFQRTLKADPRYDKTDQAKSDAMSTLAQVGKDFGLVGG